jgi:hypothetical protein
MVGLRDKKRYGLFKANSDKGEVKISISIYGWGELFKVEGTNQEGEKFEIRVDTSEDFDEDNDFIKETDNYIELYDECEGVKVYKPFIRCLKRYK